MIKFGSYQLDPASVRLFKNNQEIEIEPQVFNTLLLLIENRERVVTKDELLTEIWHGRPVTDHVITRIIYELRKLLDDKKHQNSHIRTVRGKGYQFIEPIEKMAKNHVDHPVFTERPPVKNILKVLLTAVLLALVLFFGYVFFFQAKPNLNTSGNGAPQSKPNLYPIVSVLPIDVESGNEELSMLVQSLIDYLTHQLALNLNMKVIHPDSLVSMSDQLDDVWAIQRATRSNFMIQGFVESVSEQQIKLHLNLFKKDISGQLTPISLGAFSFSFPKNAQELSELYKQRKVTVRSIIQIIKPGVVVKDNGDNETSDFEAYRLVIAAHHMSRADQCEDLQRAEQLLLNAVERDDEFAYSYYQLLANYFKRVWVCGDSIDYHQKALAMAEKVERLAPNSYSPMAIGINTILVESNQVEKAYQIAREGSWDDPHAINRIVYGLRFAGFLKLASEYIDRILQLDPFFFSQKPINQAPNTLLYQNRYKEHLALLAVTGNAYHDYYRSLNLYLSDHVEEAKAILNEVVGRKSPDLFSQLSQALLFVIEQDYSNAIKHVNKIVDQRIEKNHSDGEMTYKLVQLYALAGADEMALKYLQTSVNQGFFPANYFLQDPALHGIKNTQQFSDIVKQASQRHIAFAKQFDLEPEIATHSELTTPD